MKDARATPQAVAAAAPEVEYFDPFSHTMLFEDRRHFPASGREQFARWRDVESLRTRHRDFAQPEETNASDGAPA
jgi:hypothetical protein